MHHFASVLLHMNASDADAGQIAVAELCRTRAGKLLALLGGIAHDLQVEAAVHAESHRALGGLEVLGHVRVEVVLAVEHAALHNLAAGGQAGQHDALDGGLVRRWQRSGHAQADRADVGVWLGAKLHGAGAEHLGVEGGKLGMDFQADDGLPIPQYGLQLFHSSPPLMAVAGGVGAVAGGAEAANPANPAAATPDPAAASPPPASSPPPQLASGASLLMS